jgi:chemotaxis protein histidine kinase CheA
MPSGIIMQSSSIGATEEAINKVLEANGYEVETKTAAAPETPVEPKRDDFESDEAFAEAQEKFETAEEEAEEKAEEEAEKQRLAALPKKTRRQKAVEKATRELAETNRKLEERLAALEGKKKPETEIKVEALKTPKREDFSTEEEFEDAKFEYRYQTKRAKEQEDERKNSLNARVTKNFTEYQGSVAAFKEEHDDWDKVVGQALPIPNSVYFAIVDLADEGPAVTYYLGKHPDKIAELAEMTPYRAAIEVGRIADKLKTGGDRKTSTEKATKIPLKKIPDPVTPVSTSATSSTLTSREAAKSRDFKAFKAAQRKGV